MTQQARDDALNRILADTNAQYALRPPAMPPGEPRQTQLSSNEIGSIVMGFALSMGLIRKTSQGAITGHDLGPRGPFILSLIDRGVCYPQDLASVLRIGRSLVTAEIDRLSAAGLVQAVKEAGDRRRSRLSLTENGLSAANRVRQALAQIVTRNLAGYSDEDIRLFGRMLHDARRPILPGAE